MKKVLATALTFGLALTSLGDGANASTITASPVPAKLKEYQVIAHRGASAYAPEHTFASYDKAISMGADYIEIDALTTKDNKLVAMHDKTIDRTTNGTGKVSNLTLAQIKKLDAGSHFNTLYPSRANSSFKAQRVPTLEEIFKRYGQKTNYYIELRDKSQNKALLSLLTKYNLIGKGKEGKVVIQSFEPIVLQDFHKLNKDIPLIQLLWNQPTISQKQIDSYKKYAVGIGFDYRFATPSNVRIAHNNNLLVHTFYSSEKLETYTDSVANGANGGISNYPNRLTITEKVVNYQLEAMK